MLKKSVVVLLVFALCAPAFASRPLTNDEVLDILRTLTASPMKTWIPAGTIQATHTEYRAPKTIDTDVINSRITRDLLVAAAENATAMRVIDEPAARLSRQRIYRLQVEAMAHNVRYRVANEYTMHSNETVKYDGDRYYWEIDVLSRVDSVNPPADLEANGYADKFDMGLNEKRIFVWDGEKCTHYLLPGKHALVFSNREAVNGPLTAGCIPWGYEFYSYDNLTSLRPSGVEEDNGGQIEIHLAVTDGNRQELFVMDPAKDYALKSFTRTTGNIYMRVHTCSNHILVGGKWCPQNIIAEEYKLSDSGTTLLARDDWTITNVNDQVPATEDFTVTYEVETLIEDYSEAEINGPLIYEYASPLPPSARNVDIDGLRKERLAVVRQKDAGLRNCAAITLKHVAGEFGRFLTLEDAAEMLGNTDIPVPLSALARAAHKLGLYTLPVKTDIKMLKEEVLAHAQAILHMPANDHYVVTGGIDSASIDIIDLTDMRFYYRNSIETFEDTWDGVALLIDTEPLDLQKRYAKIDDSALESIVGACQICGDEPLWSSYTWPCPGSDPNEPPTPCATSGQRERFARYACESKNNSQCPLYWLTQERKSSCTTLYGGCIPEGNWEYTKNWYCN